LDQDNCLDLLQFGDMYDLPGTTAAALAVCLRYASDGRVSLEGLPSHLRKRLDGMMEVTGSAWGAQPALELRVPSVSGS